MNPLFAILPGVGWPEMLMLGLIALLLFGKRLPEVARSLGKGVTEFKKGIQGLEDEIRDDARYTEHRELPHATEPQAPQAPKFEPPTSPPTEGPAKPDSSEPGSSPQDQSRPAGAGDQFD